VLAEKINENATPQDRVTPVQLRDRAKWNAGQKVNKHNAYLPDKVAEIARQSAERSWDSSHPDEPIEPVIDWAETLTAPGNEKGVSEFQ
jgi:hypothetical protein